MEADRQAQQPSASPALVAELEEQLRRPQLLEVVRLVQLLAGDVAAVIDNSLAYREQIR